MTKTLAITAIVLVAVVMGISSVVPMMPKTYAGLGEGDCPKGFDLELVISCTKRERAEFVDAADGVADGLVCIKEIKTPRGERTIIIDNHLPFSELED